MQIEYGSKGLIGVLTPQANTTVEPEFWTMLPNGFSLINARLISSCLSIEERLLDYFINLENSIHQFGNAPIKILSIACTGSSYLVGRQKEEKIIDKISTSLGIPVTTSGLSVVSALINLSAKNIALCSPYPDILTKLSIEYWQSFGFHVSCVVSIAPATEHFHPIYGISAQSAFESLETLNQSDADVIVMLGTGMPTLMPLIEGNKVKDSKPIISCMLSTVWNCVSQIDTNFDDIVPWVKNPIWLDRFNAIQ
jgi:maleate isomerase